MDRLRSQDGCPWDARQTHESLSEYLLEETYETLAAIEHGDTDDLVEELGDLLLQVVFHARLGQEESPSWDIDDVANGISDKLIRRHPHVFVSTSESVGTDDSLEIDSSDSRSWGQSAANPEGAGQIPAGSEGTEPYPAGPEDAGEIPADSEGAVPMSVGPEALSRTWTRAKAAEKGRSSALDGIPQAMPALAQAQKTWRRAVESGLSPALPEALALAETSSSVGVTTTPATPATRESSDLRRSPTSPEKQPLIEAPAQPDSQEQLGGALMGLVVAAERSGLDAEAALRAAIAKMRLEIRELESPAQPGQPPPERAG